MALQGKGFFIWKVINCDGGNVETIATAAQSAGLTHILVKIADGVSSSNIDTSGVDLVPPLVQALRARNIQTWGWQFVYGADPAGEARKAIARLNALGLDGFVVDAEADYKIPGRDAAARRYMSDLRAAYPSLPIGFSSYRYPSYHPAVPYRDFLAKCDYAMPQVYWEQAHNPSLQLTRTVNEYQAIPPYRPVFPTGPTYKTGGWAPTDADINGFLDTARNLNLTGANFFNWDACRTYLPNLWSCISIYPWGSTPPPDDIASAYITALNSHDANIVANLYTSNAVHINASRTIQGVEALRNWFYSLFTHLLPSATFTLAGSSGTGNSRYLAWKATSYRGSVVNGSDTFGLASGRITYHYTYFTIT